MPYFESVFLNYGTASLTLGKSTGAPYTSTIYGGVQIDILSDTFTEDDPEYIGDFERDTLYTPVKGSFDVLITGPTISGVKYFENQLREFASLPERYYKEQAPYPTLLGVMAGSVGYMVLRTMQIKSWDKVLQGNDLKTVKLTVEYEREGLLGGGLSYPDIPNHTATTDGRYPVVTSGYATFIHSPVNMIYGLGNQATTFPSGYFLVSNAPIVVISGGYFYATSPNTGHVNQRVINEDSYSAFSKYNGARVDQGVLRTVPTTLNTSVISSGTMYGTGLPYALFGGVYIGQRAADVYVTYRTTFSGTLFDLNVIGDWQDYSTGKRGQTGYKRLAHSSTPNHAYIGRLSTDTSQIDYARLSLDIVANNAISGALLIDRVVLQPVEETYNAIFITKLQLPSTNSTYPDGSNPSGIIALELLNATVNTFASTRSPRASLRIFRENRTSKVPNYRGNINIRVKKLDILFPYGLDSRLDRGILSYYFLTHGSAYDTVSGMANWQYLDRHNNVTRTTDSIRYDAMRTFI